MARRLNRRRKNKGESRVAIIQRTAETADIEKIKLEANERNVKSERARVRADRYTTGRRLLASFNEDHRVQ